MRSFAPSGLASKGLLAGLMLCSSACGLAAAGEDQALQADHEFVRAASKGDAAAAGKLLDNDFSWTDTDGRVLVRAQVLSTMPTPALGNEEGATVKRQSRPQVEAFLVGHDKNYVLRIWVKRGAAWTLLLVHEVALGRAAGAADNDQHDCENPCKSIPYKPKNETEQALLYSFEELETAVAARDSFAFAPHVASEFMMLGSTSDHPLTKADRVSTLNLQHQTGRGALPSPVVFLQLFEFGDTVIMTSVHQPYTGKPVRASRLWIKRDGKWVMSLAFQTTIEAASAKTS
ncbi:MAG TPA: nuclear transport factor 2 family protein [Dongiaceae bacterium]|nr:nuclear transport factor 2 family protein [Dongiaceae bacterium]